MSTRLVYRLIVALTIFATLALVFFAVVGLTNPLAFSPRIGSAQEFYAQREAGRDLAVALMLLGVLLLHDRRMLGTLLAVDGLIQMFDAVIAVVHQEVTRAVAPVVLAVLYLLAACYLLLHNIVSPRGCLSTHGHDLQDEASNRS